MHKTLIQILQQSTLIQGACGWIVFSFLAVMVRGVRWEETYEHALIITGMAPYPEGHPMYIYCRNVFSGQSYLSALLLWCVDSPLLLNGLRNAMQLAFATVPVYLIGTRLGGRPWHGHVAVLLVLLGIHQGFQSYYPIEIWPHFYGVGQIGAGYVLLILALVLHGCFRSAAFLLGLMPAIHLGQVPIIGLVAAVQWGCWVRHGERARAMQTLGWAAGGLAPCVVFFLVQRQFVAPLPETGAYAAEGNAREIWAAYSALHDIHRNIPRLNPFWKSSLGALMCCVLAAGAFRSARLAGARDSGFGWVTLYATLTVVVVFTIWLVQQLLGGETPFLLIGWMPYRLYNHLAVLLAPVIVGLLLRPAHGAGAFAGRAIVLLALLYASALPVLGRVLPSELFTRYTGNPELLLFGLAGAAAAVPFALDGPRPVLRMQWGDHVVGSALFMALYYPFGAAALLAGAAGWLGLSRMSRYAGKASRAALRSVFPVAGAILLAIVGIQQARQRANLPVEPIHASVAQYLAEHGESDAMIATPYWDVGWLGKTRHPVFADYQTAHLMTYVPALAPSLKKMHAEVFGFIVDGETGAPLSEWPARSPEEWRRLADGYGIDYLLAPTELTLRLTPALEGHPYDLYRLAP